MSEDTTRAALAAAHKAWLDGGGDERDPESVARLLRGIFEGEWAPDPKWCGRGWSARIPSLGGEQAVLCDVSSQGDATEWWVGAPRRDDRRRRKSLLSALVALAAAGVPRRAEGAGGLRPSHDTPGDADPAAIVAAARTAPDLVPAPGEGEGTDEPCAGCTPGLDGDCGTCPAGAGILPGALVCDATSPYYLMRVLGVRDGRILVCGFGGQDGVPDAAAEGQVSHWLTPQGDTWTDEDGERVFRLVPAEVAEETAGAIVGRQMADPEATDGDAMARLVRSEKALSARCERLAKFVGAYDAAVALAAHPDPTIDMLTREMREWRAWALVTAARAALQPGDVPGDGKAGA